MNKSSRLDDSYFEEFMSNPKFVPQSAIVKDAISKIPKNDPNNQFLFLKCDSMNKFKRTNCNYFKDINGSTEDIPNLIAGVDHKSMTRVKQIVLAKALFDYSNNRLVIPTPTLVVNNGGVRRSITDTSYLNKNYLSGFLYSLINIQIQDLDDRIVLSNKNINIVWKVCIDERSLQKNLMDK